MTAKEYLSQTFGLEQLINSKLEQIESLNELATKVNITLTGMPKNPNHTTSTMADVILKIIDLQEDINRDIDQLVDLKRELITVIKSVENAECQTLLELRYLCFKTWEEIAAEMNYTVRNIHLLHKEALKNVVVPKRLH